MSTERKRNREKTEDTNTEEGSTERETRPFRRSKKILRSPEQRKLEEERKANCRSNTSERTVKPTLEMEELKELMQQMMQEIKKNNTELKEEIMELRKELNNKEKNWKKEKVRLSEQITQLEVRMEAIDRARKKNNIIVKGINIQADNAKKTVEDFLENELQIQTTLMGAYIINKGKKSEMVTAEVNTWNTKQEIMKAKSKLKGKNIYTQ